MSHQELVVRKDKTHDFDVTGHISDEDPVLMSEESQMSVAAKEEPKIETKAVEKKVEPKPTSDPAPKKKDMGNENIDLDLIDVFSKLAKKRQSTVVEKDPSEMYDKKDTFTKIGICFFVLYAFDTLFMWLLIECMLEDVEATLIAYIIIFAVYVVALAIWVIYETVIKAPQDLESDLGAKDSRA